MSISIIIFSLIFLLLIILILIFYFIIYENRNKELDKVNENQDTNIKTNKENINTIENQLNRIETLEKNYEQLKNDYNDFKNKFNFNGWLNFIINNKDNIKKEINNLQGKEPANYKIAFDEIKETYNNMFLALSKEDDQYRQIILDYQIKNKLL